MKIEFRAGREVKHETAEYRVIYQGGVAVRAEPWGEKIGLKSHGVTVKTDVHASSAKAGDWVRLVERFGPLRAEGWMLVDGNVVGLAKLLERVDKVKRSRVQRCAAARAAAAARSYAAEPCGGWVVAGTRW